MPTIQRAVEAFRRKKLLSSKKDWLDALKIETSIQDLTSNS